MGKPLLRHTWRIGRQSLAPIFPLFLLAFATPGHLKARAYLDCLHVNLHKIPKVPEVPKGRHRVVPIFPLHLPPLPQGRWCPWHSASHRIASDRNLWHNWTEWRPVRRWVSWVTRALILGVFVLCDWFKALQVSSALFTELKKYFLATQRSSLKNKFFNTNKF